MLTDRETTDLLGVIAGFRIERRGIHTIKVWDATGCQSATPEETLLWDKLIEARKEIERLETELSQTQEELMDGAVYLERLIREEEALAAKDCQHVFLPVGKQRARCVKCLLWE